MIEADQDALYGKAKREEKEAKKHFAFLQAELIRLGEILGQFSNLIHTSSHLIQVEGEEFAIFSPIDSNRKLEGFKKSDFDGEKIAALLKELEQARRAKQHAEEKVKELEG
jgi:hypothetical protein